MDAKNYDQAVEIAPNTFWVGYHDTNSNFHCNPYLILAKNESILIDPGSNPHFPIVARKVSSITRFNNIKYIIIHHQDPDLVANIPVFEKLINRDDLRVVTTKRASFLTNYYGFKTPYRLVEEGPLTINERRFEFLNTPYLHAPGAFSTYDKKNKILFSSDIFGAFDKTWNLYADADYPKRMYQFHHDYMSPGDTLAKQIEKFEKLDINLIAPQHGSVIKKKMIKPCFEALKTIPTGGYLENE